MRRQIEKAAVLGAGTMGARIAAHLANAGIPCYLLDIVPPELNADEKRKGLTLENPAVRNRIVLAGLEAAKKSRPAAFFTAETARLITPGNFEDNLAWCGEVDWIIEAVAENLEIKRKLFERVEAVRKPGTIVTSNTSGLPIRLIAEGRSEDFQQHWAGTHFFNPPRYMKLVELIPGPKTLPAVLESLDEICDVRLGKGVVVAKDTPNFIANRIGTFSILNAFRQMQTLEMTIEEVDACTGPAIGWPKSATFRTADIVGLDVLVHVIRNIYENAASDESREIYQVPPLVEEMMKRGWLGEKTGSGFYKRVKGAGGESEILTLDWQKMEYRPRQKAKFGSIEAGKGIESTRERLRDAGWSGAGRQGRRQGESVFVGDARRDVPVRGAPRFRKSPTRSWTWIARCAGDSAGNLGRLRCGTRSASSGWRRRSSATGKQMPPLVRESAGVADKIVLRIGEGAHELFRFVERRAEAAGRACGHHHSEIAEGTHGGGAGKFRREPDRSGRRRGLLRISLQDERDRRRHRRDDSRGRGAAGNGFRGDGDREPGGEFFGRRESDAVADDRAGRRVGRYSSGGAAISAREHGDQVRAAAGGGRAAGNGARRRMRNQSARRANSRGGGNVHRAGGSGRGLDSRRAAARRKC